MLLLVSVSLAVEPVAYQCQAVWVGPREECSLEGNWTGTGAGRSEKSGRKDAQKALVESVTLGARAAADRIRDEIDSLARNGRLAGTLVKYSFFSIDETSATYEVLVVRERAKWLSWGVVVLTLALAFTVWLSTSLYKARKRADEANAVKEEFITRYTMAARATDDAIWDWNVQTDQVFWQEGACALFGYSVQEVGTDITWWQERIHPEDRDRVIQGISNSLSRGEQKWSDEYRFRRKAARGFQHAVRADGVDGKVGAGIGRGPIVRRLRRRMNHQRDVRTVTAEHAINFVGIADIDVQMPIAPPEFLFQLVALPVRRSLCAEELLAHIVVDADDIEPVAGEVAAGFGADQAFGTSDDGD
jgi:PAS domain S-box-containing protein